MEDHLVKVIIADDMPQIVKNLTRLVRTSGGMDVIATAASGYEAITAVLNNPCDAALIDASMETQRAGIYACREILKLSPGIKIIIMLEDPEVKDSELIIRAFQYGAINVIQKSSNDATVRRVIYDAAEGRTSLGPEIASRIIAEIRRIKNIEDNYRYLIDVFMKLTPSELEILKLLESGVAQRDIPGMRFIESVTLKTHISHILQKFNAPNIKEVMEVIHQTNFFSLIK